jgi:hypothetical protein
MTSEYICIDPDKVYFTHARIRSTFSGCGRKVEDTIRDIIEHRLALESLPLITILNCNGAFFSLNNRRLYVLKHLRKVGFLSPHENLVKVRLKSPLSREVDKYKTESFTLSASLMGDKERPAVQSEKGGALEKQHEDALIGDCISSGRHDSGGDIIALHDKIKCRVQENELKNMKDTVQFSSLSEKVRKNYKTMIGFARKGRQKDLEEMLKAFQTSGELPIEHIQYIRTDLSQYTI